MSRPTRQLLALTLLAGWGCGTPPAGSAPSDAAAPLLRLTEFDQDGGSHPHQARGGSFIDVNSRLELELDRDRIRQELADRFPAAGLTTEDLATLEALVRRANEGMAGLPAAQRALEQFGRFDDPTGANFAAVEAALSHLAGAALDIEGQAGPDFAALLELRLEQAIESALAAGTAPSTAESYRLIFATAEDIAAQLRARMDAALQAHAVHLQLGAWMVQDGNSQPLHLPGFDDYPEGEFFEVERWMVLPSDEQLAQLESLEQVAQQAQAAGAEVRKLLLASARGLLGEVLGEAKECLRNLEERLSAIEAQGSGLATDLRNRAAGVAAQAKTLRRFTEDSLDRYGSGEDPLALWRRLPEDVRELERSAGQLAQQAMELHGALSAAAASIPPALRDQAQAAQAELAACAGLLEERLGPLARDLARTLGIARSAEGIQAEALEFGAEVRRLSLGELPRSTELDLLTKGRRAAGDRVLLKLGAGRVDARDGSATAPQTLASRRLDLERVLPHFETSVNLIFVDPNGSRGPDQRWVYAPAYSILYRGGSRHSSSYNRLLRPSIGLNIALVDLDDDESPELGLGLVTTLFRDILQVGYGYDVSEDRYYAFFGIGLPISAIAESLR